MTGRPGSGLPPAVRKEPNPEAVRRDLLYLRKGVGFTPERFASCTDLTLILGGDAEPVEVLQERLESAIHSLHDDDEALLLCVYGFDKRVSGMATLAARRAVVASQLGLTREAVADRDANAIERLLFQLLTGWYPKSPMPIRVPESHGDIVNLVVHLSTVVTNRKHELTRHRYRFLALFDGAEYLAIAATEPALVQVTHGAFALRTVTAERGVVHQFWHETPLERGRVYDLAFTVRNPDLANDPYWLTEESLAFHEPTRLARFDVEFKGELPDLVWWFRGLTAAERPGIPSASRLLNVDDRGRVAVDMRELNGGLSAGAAWAWC